MNLQQKEIIKISSILRITANVGSVHTDKPEFCDKKIPKHIYNILRLEGLIIIDFFV